MTKNYKLTEEIRGFIIKQKNTNPKLSCRALCGLIKVQFQVNISKSLINNVIKENKLSSPVGRRRIREPMPIINVLPEIKFVKKEVEFMENGGLFFVKAADIKLGLTNQLADILSGYYPGFTKPTHQRIIETLVYSRLFKDKRSLWLFVGSEIPEESLVQYSREIVKIPVEQAVNSLKILGINHNINEINDLWENTLLRLNSYIVHSFPPEYQFLDFLAMQERFYSLPARIEKKRNLLIIQLFYPPGFFWMNDIIWQEGLSYAANKVNEAKILTPENEQIYILPQVQLLEGNAFSHP